MIAHDKIRLTGLQYFKHQASVTTEAWPVLQISFFHDPFVVQEMAQRYKAQGINRNGMWVGTATGIKVFIGKTVEE